MNGLQRRASGVASAPPAARAEGSFASPLGRIRLAATQKGLARVGFEEERWPAAPADGGNRAQVQLEQATQALHAYLDGGVALPDLDLDLSELSPFQQRVLGALRQVPFGRTTTYGQLAVAAGVPRCARAVGRALASNPLPLVLPCHRVMLGDGEPGGYRGGKSRKAFLLELESAAVNGLTHS